MNEPKNLRFLWRVIILVIIVILLGAISITVRDSGFTLGSTEWLAEKIRGSNPPWSIVDAIANLLLMGTILVAVIWIGWPRFRYQRLRRNQQDQDASDASAKADHALVPDAPLSHPSQDELERFHFAREIVHTITVTPPVSSFVVGIEGRWGEGKTTILHWVHEELKAHVSKPVLVRFDP